MSLVWQNKPHRELVRLAWPIAVSTLSYSIMTVVDTVLIGHVGRAQLAGVGLSGVLTFLLLCFSIGLLVGAKVLVAQAIGADRRDRAEGYLVAAVATALVVGVITILLGQLLALGVGHLTASEEAGAAARTYLRVRILGAPLVLLYVALREVRYAVGDARSPMLSTVAAQITNIALALLFIFVLKWGVAGAAAATIVAHGVEAGLLLFAERTRGFRFRRPERTYVVALFRVGLPTGLQYALEVGSFATLSLLISLFSEIEMAAHQISIQVIHFSFLPAMAVAEAASVLIGQAVGAGKDELVPRVSRLAMVVTAIYAGMWSVVLVAASPLIVSGFTSDAAVITAAVGLLHIAAVFQVFDAANIVARCALRGTGDVRFAAVTGVLVAWIFTPTLAWILGRHYGLGARGGWIGLCAEILVSAAVLWHRLLSGGWRQSAVLARESLIERDDDPRLDQLLPMAVTSSSPAESSM